jgi:hypothetical protein
MWQGPWGWSRPGHWAFLVQREGPLMRSDPREVLGLLSCFFCRCKLPLTFLHLRLRSLPLLHCSHPRQILFAPGSCKFWCYRDKAGTSTLSHPPGGNQVYTGGKSPTLSSPGRRNRPNLPLENGQNSPSSIVRACRMVWKWNEKGNFLSHLK